MLVGRLGWTAVGATLDDTWYTVVVVPLNQDISDAGDKTYRTRVRPPAIAGVGGTKLRLRLRGPDTGSTRVGEMWIGKVARSASGSPLANALQIRVGGETEFTLPEGEEIITDSVVMSVNVSTEDIVTSMYVTDDFDTARAGSTFFVSGSDMAYLGMRTAVADGNEADTAGSLGAPAFTVTSLSMIETNAPYTPPGTPAFSWTQLGIWPTSGITQTAGWNGYTLRVRARSPALGSPTGPWVRVRLEARKSGGNGVVLQKMFASLIPSSQTSLDRGTAFVPVRFGGSSGVTLAVNAEIWSDPFEMPGFGGSGLEQILLSCYFNGTTDLRGTNDDSTNWIGRWRVGDSANDAGAWGAGSGTVRYLIAEIESSPIPA